MKVLNDYQCSCGKTQERFIDTSIEEVDCECGLKATKVVGAFSYFKIDGFREDINSSQWAKRREQDYKRRNSGKDLMKVS